MNDCSQITNDKINCICCSCRRWKTLSVFSLEKFLNLWKGFIPEQGLSLKTKRPRNCWDFSTSMPRLGSAQETKQLEKYRKNNSMKSKTTGHQVTRWPISDQLSVDGSFGIISACLEQVPKIVPDRRYFPSRKREKGERSQTALVEKGP